MSVRESALKYLQTIFLVAVLLTVKACGCKSNCSQHDYYQEMERALISDAENLFKLRQMFFPTLVNRYPQDKLAIKVCILISNDQKSKNHSAAPTEMCWVFDYSTTLLTALITPAQLYAFESITTFLLITTAVRLGFREYGRVYYEESINLPIEIFPCTVTDEDLYNSLAILTSWVRYTNTFEVPSLRIYSLALLYCSNKC